LRCILFLTDGTGEQASAVGFRLCGSIGCLFGFGVRLRLVVCRNGRVLPGHLAATVQLSVPISRRIWRVVLLDEAITLRFRVWPRGCLGALRFMVFAGATIYFSVEAKALLPMPKRTREFSPVPLLKKSLRSLILLDSCNGMASIRGSMS